MKTKGLCTTYDLKELNMSDLNGLVFHNRFSTINAVCQYKWEKESLERIADDMMSGVLVMRPLQTGESLHVCFSPVLAYEPMIGQPPLFRVPVSDGWYRSCEARLALWVEHDGEIVFDVKHMLRLCLNGVAIAQGPTLPHHELMDLIREIIAGDYGNVDAMVPARDIVKDEVQPQLDGMVIEHFS